MLTLYIHCQCNNVESVCDCEEVLYMDLLYQAHFIIAISLQN